MRNWGFKGALEKPSLLLQGISYKEVSGVNEPTKKAVRLIYHFKKVERLNRCHAGAVLNTIVPLNRHDTSTRLTFSFDTSQMQNLFLFFEMVDKKLQIY